MSFSTMTPPSRSMIDTSTSVVVEGSVASRRSSFGGEDGLAIAGVSAFAAAWAEGDGNVEKFLGNGNAMWVDRPVRRQMGCR